MNGIENFKNKSYVPMILSRNHQDKLWFQINLHLINPIPFILYINAPHTIHITNSIQKL